MEAVLELNILVNPPKYWWQIWIPVEIEIVIDAWFTYEINNNSIGWYEFWGYKCYDDGEDFVSNVIYNGKFDLDRQLLPYFIRNSVYLDTLIHSILDEKANDMEVYQKISDIHFDS